MSKNMKRVPSDFNWPIHQTWRGYVSPYHPVQCKSCRGLGYSKEYLALKDEWYGRGLPSQYAWQHNLTQEDVQALVDNDRLYNFTRVPLNDEQQKDVLPNGWLPYYNGYVPTAEEVNEWSHHGFGHDGMNMHYVISAKLKKLGQSEICVPCGGKGHFWQSPEIEKAAEEWKDIDPPTGDGYQLWDDEVPISPVFADDDSFYVWCEQNTHIFGDHTATSEEWKSMLINGKVYYQAESVILTD